MIFFRILIKIFYYWRLYNCFCGILNDSFFIVFSFQNPLFWNCCDSNKLRFWVFLNLDYSCWLSRDLNRLFFNWCWWTWSIKPIECSTCSTFSNRGFLLFWLVLSWKRMFVLKTNISNWRFFKNHDWVIFYCFYFNFKFIFLIRSLNSFFIKLFCLTSFNVWIFGNFFFFFFPIFLFVFFPF